MENLENEKGNYYLYKHLKLDDNTIFYIGIGTKHKGELDYSRAYAKSSRTVHWKRIVNKYGYKVEIIAESNDYEWVKKEEIRLIAFYGRADLEKGTLCNMTDGGDGLINLVFTKEHKEKIAKGRSGKKHSEKTKLQISEKKKNSNIPNPNIGRKMSDESRKKMSEAAKGRVFSREHIEKVAKINSKEVLQYTLSGEFIQEFKSIKEAYQFLNKQTDGYISKCCSGKIKSAYKYIWKYKNQ